MPDIVPYVLLDDQATGLTRRYENPIDIIRAETLGNVAEAFDAVQSYLNQGYYVAGFTAYELGYALEPKLSTLLDNRQSGPLLCFGVFKAYKHEPMPDCAQTLAVPPVLRPQWSEADYVSRFERVINYIKAGDVYQINLSYPMRGAYEGSAADLYAAFRQRQPGRYGGVVSLGGADIISFSPELFFKTDDEQIEMRPMKGTARRMADPAQDRALRDHMKTDEKSRAENLMIVDLLRNDLSRIAAPGTVKVPALFSLETYPTLHQMTSHVRAKLNPGIEIADMFKSLFPCGSITGAPKIRAMEIIDTLENSRRGIYGGAIIALDRADNLDTCIAIRTAMIKNGVAQVRAGSGIVHDSDPFAEAQETRHKARSVMTAIETAAGATP